MPRLSHVIGEQGLPRCAAAAVAEPQQWLSAGCQLAWPAFEGGTAWPPALPRCLRLCLPTWRCPRQTRCAPCSLT